MTRRPSKRGDALVALALARARQSTGVAATDAWSVPLWVFDPVHGSDSNRGTDDSSPLQHWSAVLQRYGTPSPILRQRVGFRWLASQPDSSDPIVFDPVLVGGGGYDFTGAPQVLATANVVAVQPANPAAGTATQVQSDQTGSFWSAFVGRTVRDVTAGAQFIVESDQGAGAAQVSAPKAVPVTEFGVDAPIASGDALEILSLPTIYPARLDNTDFGSGAGLGVSLAQLDLRADFAITLGSGVSVLECTINGASITPSRTVDAEAGPVFTSCYFGVGGLGGAPFSGVGGIYGGVLHQAGNNFKDGSVLDGDVLCMLRVHTSGTVKIGRCYWGQTNTLDNPPTVYNLLNQNTGSARLWGPGGLALVKGSKCLLTGVTADAALLLKGALTLDGQSVGYPWLPGSNGYGAAVALTPGAIDAAGGLTNPATGGGFIFG